MEVSEIVIAVVVVIVAYFLGTFPSAELVAKRFGRDITKVGSGNPGARELWVYRRSPVGARGADAPWSRAQ